MGLGFSRGVVGQMGRQPAFERDEVLDKATQVFLSNGFQRTTIKDITKATGLQPGSIYSAFENKNGLYTEVIEHYTKREIQLLEKCIEEHSTNIAAVKAFFKITGRHITNRNPEAHCLLVYGVFEIPKSEKELRYYIQLKIHEIESRIYALLVKAQENDEIVCDEDPVELSRFLMTLLFGHRVLAQLRLNSKTVDNTIERVFRILESKS